jgi:hypothetical protein
VRNTNDTTTCDKLLLTDSRSSQDVDKQLGSDVQETTPRGFDAFYDEALLIVIMILVH